MKNHSQSDALQLGDTVNKRKSINIAAVQPPLRTKSTSPVESAQIVKQIILQQYNKDTTTAIDLFVLPELSPIGYSQDTFETYLSHHDDHDDEQQVKELTKIQDEIQTIFSDLAQDLDVYICYGTIGILPEYQQQQESITIEAEESCNNRRFTIRQIVIDPNGQNIAHYDKIHLCNYGDCAETKYFTNNIQHHPSSHPTHCPTNLTSFTCRDSFQIGILICADIRDPMLTRKLAQHPSHKVDVIIQPAAFGRDVSFRTWKSFRETRAVENSIYWLGINYGGEYFGESTFVGPWVDEFTEPISLGVEGQSVLVGTVERETLDRVRREMPFYQRLMDE